MWLVRILVLLVILQLLVGDEPLCCLLLPGPLDRPGCRLLQRFGALLLWGLLLLVWGPAGLVPLLLVLMLLLNVLLAQLWLPAVGLVCGCIRYVTKVTQHIHEVIYTVIMCGSVSTARQGSTEAARPTLCESMCCCPACWCLLRVF